MQPYNIRYFQLNEAAEVPIWGYPGKKVGPKPKHYFKKKYTMGLKINLEASKSNQRIL